jgi:uncharacterized Zn finger protein (UPF0148 family)
MACPRCDSPLERYTLGETEAVVCGRCGYTGVPVEHTSEPVEAESWQAALDRFQRDRSVGAVDGAAGDDAETAACPVCGETFETRRGMRIHRGLVHDEADADQS